MNDLIVNGKQNFMGIEIPIIEGGFGENKRTILVNTISEIHRQSIGKINELINNNIEEFDFGIDIINLKDGGNLKSLPRI